MLTRHATIYRYQSMPAYCERVRVRLRRKGTPMSKTVWRAILIVTIALVSTAPAGRISAAPNGRPFPIDLEHATAAQLQEAMTARRVTSEDLVDAYLDRI